MNCQLSLRVKIKLAGRWQLFLATCARVPGQGPNRISGGRAKSKTAIACAASGPRAGLRSDSLGPLRSGVQKLAQGARQRASAQLSTPWVCRRRRGRQARACTTSQRGWAGSACSAGAAHGSRAGGGVSSCADENLQTTPRTTTKPTIVMPRFLFALGGSHHQPPTGDQTHFG